MEQGQGIRLNRKIFLQSTFILFALVLFAGVLTQILPAGEYERKVENGVSVIQPHTFHYLDQSHSYPLYRTFTAPFELFFSHDALTVIIIILFILIIGGSFSIFGSVQIFERMIDGLLQKLESRRNWLIVLFSLFFMLLGSLFGILEEVIPLIPIMIMVSNRLGWDELMGLGLSLLSVGFGFSAALYNPFTIGIAQKLAGVPMFSGMLYRIFIFILTYAILLTFLFRYAKKLEKQQGSLPEQAYREISASSELRAESKKGIKVVAAGFILLLLLMMLLPVISLSDYSMPIIALGILIISILSSLACKLPVKVMASSFWKGVGQLAPSSILIILAMSVKHIFESAKIMDSFMYSISNSLNDMGSVMGGSIMYLLVFVLQFFIPSATAKAFLVMPILTPLGDLLHITRQSVVLAFNFGDGFSHLLYPTNPALLIALSLTSVSFVKWLKWTIGIQILLFILTLILLIAAILFEYGPI